MAVVHVHLEQHTPFPLTGVLVCKTVPFVQTTAIVTGILTMTCIALERYQGIVYPLKMRRQYTLKRAYKMLGRLFLFLLVLSCHFVIAMLCI